MQHYSLTLDKLVDHAANWSGERQIVSATAAGTSSRINYAALRTRSNRLSGALTALGMALGDRLGTLAWNTQHHLETYFATTGAGLICHTLNPRLTPRDLIAIINEAEDRVIAVASSLVPLLAEMAPFCPTIEHVIVLDDDGDSSATLEGARAPRVWLYEDLLEHHGRSFTWGNFDEDVPAGLCYTSGTTGPPKGVLYTHRSNYLHALRALQADAIALKGSDVVLVAVPLFHVNGWGFPFAAPAVGAGLVLPGRHLDGASLTNLLREERVTIAAGIHTVWLGVLDHLDATGGELPDLQRVIIGGSKCPESIIRRMEERLGVQVQTSWGMTELSPLGTVTAPGAPPSASLTAGRPPLGLDLKLTDADNTTLPSQRGVVGHLKVKGASVIDRYYLADTVAVDEDGYFDTGDLASIDAAGNLTIRGRSKDLIKSGGEWINPAEIEELVGHHEDVRLVAVIGRPDEKWGERPLLVIEPQPERVLDESALLDSLRGRLAGWWIPDYIVQIQSMPLAATGKIDKNALRRTLIPNSAGHPADT